MTELSWKAVKRGDRYCAPACGHGCTYAEYQYAMDAGQKLADRLNADEVGGGWKPRVWENLGWHYGAIDSTGRMKVYPLYDDGTGGFHAFLGEHDRGGRWVENGKTPRAAARNVIARARQELREIETLLEGW